MKLFYNSLSYSHFSLNLKKGLLFILVFNYLPQLSFSQKKSILVSDSIVATNFNKRAAEFITVKKYDSAIYYFQKAGLIYRQAQAWNRFFYKQFQVGYYLNVQQKYKENVSYLEYIEKGFGTKLTPQLKSYQRFYGVKSWAYFKLIQLDKALYYFNLLLKGAEINPSVSTSDILYANYYKGLVYQRIGQYDLALQQMNIAKALCTHERACSYLGNTYNNLGIIYRNLGEYNRAAEFYLKALTLLKKTEHEVRLTPIYNNLGKVYLYLNRPDEALKELNYAIGVLTNYTQDYYPVESALTNTKAQVLLELGNFKNAQRILETILEREIDHYKEIGSNSSETLFTLGKLYAKQGLLEQSNAYLNQSIEIIQMYLGVNNDKSAEVINLIGKNQIRSKNYLQAIKTFQKCSRILVPAFTATDFGKNPLLNNVILDRVELVEALYQKSEALLLLYLNNKLIIYLDAACKANNTATQLVEQVRKSMLYESSIIRLSKKAKSIYEQSIQIELIRQADLGKNINLPVFKAMENSKSYTLADAVQRAKSLGYSAQTDSIIKKEATYKTIIKLLETRLRSASLHKNDSSKVNQIKQDLFAAKEVFEQYEQTGNGWRKHTKLLTSPTINNLQQNLASKDLLIEYFAGKTTLYALAITKEKAEVFELGNYKQIVNLFRKSISQNTPVQDFQKVSNQTYNVILAPILHSFTSVTRLILIPDKQLGYIPFDALISKSKKAPTFLNLNYLLADYTLLQHQSAGLYIANIFNTNTTTNSYVGFAPDFSKEDLSQLVNRTLRGNLQPLPFAKKEVEQILELLGGSIETGRDANEKTFKSLATQYNILHVASHAVIDNKNPLYSKLVFSEGNLTHNEDGNLYSFEIYGLNLTCDLVTLSACNTGNGKFYEGEGIFSLGRAFLMAGAKSVLASLWEVSDQSTSIIMESFYRNLKKGKSKPEALRRAKLTYLKKADALTANPYYWAGFVYTGTPEIVYKSYNVYYWMGLIILLLIVGFGIAKAKKH